MTRPAVPLTRGAGPLDGVVVLDFSRVLSGPHCTRTLVDLGAEVIKVEPPEGDITRYAQPRVNSLATYFVQQNVGKKAISLDLDHEEGVELLRLLADQVDVVVENFRPGVMDRMGLGYGTLSARNPRLVYASISGFGQTGPWRDRRAYAPVVQAESGYTIAQASAYRRRGLDMPYLTDEHSHADVYTALEAAVSICAALFRRGVTGTGQHIDIAMLESMLMVNEHVQNQLFDGVVPPGFVRSYQPGDFLILTTADGTVCATSGHPAEPGTFERFAASMGRPDLAQEDARYVDPPTRMQHFGELCGEIEAWAATVPDAPTLDRIFAANNIAMGVLRSVVDVAGTDWAVEREAILAVTDRGSGAVNIPNSPWTFSVDDSGARGIPKYRGEDNREVLSSRLGLTDADLDRLEAEGVLTSRLPRQ